MNWHDPDVPKRSRTESPPREKLRIIVQYRTKLGMVYELESAGFVMKVCVAYRRELGDPPGCLVTAEALSRGELARVEASAETPTHALREVARAWRETTPALTSLHWGAAQVALQAVHAL